MTINWEPSEKQYLTWNLLQDTEHTEIFYGGGAGGGKAQPLNSLVLTPDGFKRMGDIKIGDDVVTPFHGTSKVIAIHPQGIQQIYQLIFIDGSSIKVTGEHLFDCWIAGHKRQRKIRNVYRIIEIFNTERKRHNHIIIPLADPLEYGSDYNEISPYLIGVLLGDGGLTTGSLNITTSDSDIIDKISKELNFNNYIQKGKAKYRWNIKCGLHNKKGYCFNPLKDKLRELGMMCRCEQKRVPTIFLNSSLKTRLELIKGLMDTDGTIDQRGHCSFTSKSRGLCEDLQYLIRSIGGKATLNQKIKFCWYKGEKKEGIYWELYINTNDNSQLFCIARKKSMVKKYNGGYELGKRLIQINKLNQEECQCITIEDEYGLYISDDFTVTHNSYLGCVWLLVSSIRYPKSRWLMGRAVLKTLKQTTLLTFFDICAAWGMKPKRDYEYNSNDGRIKFANGSEIYMKDLAFYPADPEYDSLGSTEYTGAFIDEASQIKNKAKNIVMSRLRYRLDEFGLVPKLLIASNPSKNFLYKEFYKPWKENKLEKYRMFIPSLVQDNPFISQHYITNLHKLDPVSKQRLLYGNFDYDDDPARLFDYDDIMDLFTNMPEKRDKKYLTVDVARKGKDLTTVFYWEGLLVRGIWAYQYENREHPFSGIQTIHGNSTQQTLKILQDKCETLHIQRSHVVIDEDGVGGGLVDMFHGCKGFVNNSSPIQIHNKKSNFSNLKSQCYFMLADLARQGKIGVRSTNEDFKEALVEELEQVKQKDIDKDGKLAIVGKDDMKEKLGRSPDFADAFMMRMLYEMPQGKMSFLTDPDNLTGLY